MKRIIDSDKLISLFLIVTLGNLCIVSYFLIPVSNSILLNSFREGLFLAFILSYEFTLISLIGHYANTKREKVIESIKSNPIKYTIVLLIIGLATYGIIVYLQTGEILSSLEKMFWWFILFVGGLLAQLIITKLYKKANS